MRALLATLALSLGVAVAACSSDPTEDAALDRAQLLDAKSCARCHPNHYREWSSSMHAYASDDPVMLAVNALGQRDTKGALGDFCVKCHAPMALREGATKDGLNLASVPSSLKGVTCFFCHSVDAVQDVHDDALHLATDGVMRGPLRDATPTSAHASGYSSLHDRDRIESTTLCGSCHDLTAGPLAVERTYGEWSSTVFARTDGGATCGQCHMPQTAGTQSVAAVNGAPLRRRHDHSMPALDVSLLGSAIADQQQKQAQNTLDPALQSALCVGRDGTIDVLLENVAAGHSWPSGGAQHRRAWVEVMAYANGQLVYESGVVPEGVPLSAVEDHDRWEMRECLLDADGKETLEAWRAAGLESFTLGGLLTFDPRDPRFYRTHVYRRFPRTSAPPAVPDRVTMRVRVQPIALEILDAVIASGDLDPKVRDAMPTFETARVEWTRDAAVMGYVDEGMVYSCVSSTNFNFAADRTPAPEPVKCAP